MNNKEPSQEVGVLALALLAYVIILFLGLVGGAIDSRRDCEYSFNTPLKVLIPSHALGCYLVTPFGGYK